MRERKGFQMVAEIKMFFDKPSYSAFGNYFFLLLRHFYQKNFTKLTRNTCDRNFEGQSPEDVI